MDNQPSPPSQSNNPPGIKSSETPFNNQMSHDIDDIMGCVTALETALLPCLPARELQAIDRSPHPSHQIDVERHAGDFTEAAKKLHLYFMGLKGNDHHTPARAETLKKEIVVMEEELKTKEELIKKHKRLIQESQKLVKQQIQKHQVDLDKV